MDTKRVQIFNFSENKIMYDERKKRFTYLDSANSFQYKTYMGGAFNNQRPDLALEDQRKFRKDLVQGQSYLRAMCYMNKLELRRLYRTLGASSYLHVYPIMEDYLKQVRLDGPRVDRVWTWKDATRIVEYYRQHVRRSIKYGLDNGQCLENRTKEAFQEKENELVDYFLSEMRKKPVV